MTLRTFAKIDEKTLTISQWRELQQTVSEPTHILSLLERAQPNTSNAWISLATSEQITTQWEKITLLRSQGRNLPLFGVPFAAKDNIDAEGFCTTAACPSFSTGPVAMDSTVIQRLKAQGAILIGKTNLDQFATGLVGTRSPYGAVANSFDPSRVSGGSSSGSSVVVAQGLVPFSLGTDTAGSGRWFGRTKQAEAYQTALAKAQQLGWNLDPVDFTPLFSLASLLYEGPWVAERYAAIEKFIRSVPAESMDPVVRGIIMKAEQFSAADLFACEYRRQNLSREIEQIFGQYDALLVPTSPTFPTMQDLKDEPVAANSQLGTYTNFVNFMDWSALAIPAGWREDGLPFGITLIGGAWEEPRLMELARRWMWESPRLLGATGVEYQERLSEPTSLASL
ncbi:Urea carboxylase [Penicillium atrosanguineum]|nr:Urea carboxylase [Penicillium atrosanguineum]